MRCRLSLIDLWRLRHDDNDARLPSIMLISRSLGFLGIFDIVGEYAAKLRAKHLRSARPAAYDTRAIFWIWRRRHIVMT